MPAHVKHPDDRAGHHGPPKALSAPVVPATPPDPPEGLPEPLRRSWVGLWASPVAQLLDPVSDLPATSRLFQLYVLAEEVAELTRNLDAETAPALVRTRLAVAAEVRMLESQLGLSPRARLALGLALLAGRKGVGSLDEMADDANE